MFDALSRGAKKGFKRNRDSTYMRLSERQFLLKFRQIS